jgi:hypothetical protein
LAPRHQRSVRDDIRYARLHEAAEAGGVARDQAEADAEAKNDYLRPDLATKDDIAALRTEIQPSIALLRQDTARR